MYSNSSLGLACCEGDSVVVILVPTVGEPNESLVLISAHDGISFGAN